MKGVFIHNQLEYRIETKGDVFLQGDQLAGAISVKNHSGNAQSLNGLFLELACADMKKVKERSPDAFTPIASADLGSLGEVAAQKQVTFSFNFSLDKNCVVTEKNQALHLLYGNTTTGARGQALLTIEPHPHFRALVRTLESPHQFDLKGFRSADGWVIAKLKPPEVKKFTLVSELNLGARFEGEALLLRYLFNVKKFEAGVSSLGVKKGKKEIEQRLERADYLFPGEIFNHDFLDGKIAEALAEVAVEI